MQMKRLGAMQVCYLLILICLIFRLKYKCIKNIDMPPCRIEFISWSIHLKWLIKKKIGIYCLSLSAHIFSSSVFSDKWRKKKEGWRGKWRKGHGNNWDRQLFRKSCFLRVCRAQCLYGCGGKRLLRDTQSMKIRFLLWITLGEFS